MPGRRWVGLLAGIASVTTSLAGPGASAATAWRAQPTPNPASATRSQLVGVSCPAARLCLAVGYSSVQAGAYGPLAERWTGGRWSLQRVPPPTRAGVSVLDAVSCVSPQACTATGYFTNSAGVPVPLAEHWNGSRWSVQRPPLPPGAASANLVGTSCATRTSCTAVGSYEDSSGNQDALAEAWDGHRWSIEPIAGPGGAVAARLTGVSCPAPTACTAVGTIVDLQGGVLSLVEDWNGSQWSTQPSPDPSPSDTELTAVSCPSPRACEAVGFFAPGAGLRTLAEHWDGTSWTTQPTPNRQGRTNQLFGVACVSTTACTAVGNFADHRGSFASLVEHGRRGRWLVQLSARPAGSSNSGLDAVSCAGPGRCTAVGYSIQPPGRVVTLAEQQT
ncbi:MAG: hypothetical protein JO244_06875 [Solirubrobacterales bacterium]|nr:hypothetical protein [Solirubrobacterales bacterium]